MRAIFGASQPGVNWQTVISDGLAVLLDFRQDFDVERRRFKMIWTFNYFLDFVKRRGAGRHTPISLMIDELSSLFSVDTLNGELFGKDLDELINVIARNYRIWLTIAHQEQFQLTERIQKALMTLGTQIIGITSDWEASLTSAKQFFRYDPYWVKKYEPIGAQGYRSVEFTVEEQIQMASHKFTDLGRFQFLVRPALKEGSVMGCMLPISIYGFDHGLYPLQDQILRARELLTKRSGKSVNEILVEIDNRLSGRKVIQASSETHMSTAIKSPSLWTD